LDAVDDSISGIRDDLVARTLKGLRADAARCDGVLQRSDVDKYYSRRALSVAECAAVEKQLSQDGIVVNDDIFDTDEDEYSGGAGNRTASGPQIPKRRYLTEQEERDCGRRVRLAQRHLEEGGQGHDEAYLRQCLKDAERARDLLVVTNLRYVWQIAHRSSRGTHLSAEDLFQEGTVGLMRATELFDPDLGFRFKTYATWWIRQAITRAIANGEREIRVPVHVLEKRGKIRKAKHKFALEKGRAPSIKELSDYIGADAERLTKLIWYLDATETVSGEVLISEEIRLFDALTDQALPSPAHGVESGDLAAHMAIALRSLPARQERVIRMRFGLGLPRDYTLEEIGQQMGVTRERIRQIEAKGLKMLRHPTRSRRLRNLLD
jgi:RNA polymerase primary sigma factor